MLQRFENKEKRDTLQRQEDFKVLEQILEDRIKEIRDLVVSDFQKTSRKNKEKVTVSSSSSSSTSTKFRSSKEHHASRRTAKSASERKKERISRIQNNEDEEDDTGWDGRESRKMDDARRRDRKSVV